tara:strand:- start:47 stop:220 length:174 start_codon:yes stop_codon:yes gene_type:complete
MQQPQLLSESATKEVLVIRKIELLIDVISAIEGSNVPDAYGIKVSVIHKIEDLIDEI